MIAAATPHPARERLLGLVRAYPGATAEELARRAEANRTNCAHHLRVLERSRAVARSRDGRCWIYHLPAMTQQRAAWHRRVRTVGGEPILDLLATRGAALSANVIAGALALAPRTAYWRLCELRALGALERDAGRYRLPCNASTTPAI